MGAAGTVGIMAGYFQREVANSGVLKPESDLTAEVGAFGQILRIGPAGGDDITEGMFPDESACRHWNKALAGQQIPQLQQRVFISAVAVYGGQHHRRTAAMDMAEGFFLYQRDAPAVHRSADDQKILRAKVVLGLSSGGQSQIQNVNDRRMPRAMASTVFLVVSVGLK